MEKCIAHSLITSRNRKMRKLDKANTKSTTNKPIQKDPMSLKDDILQGGSLVERLWQTTHFLKVPGSIPHGGYHF